MIFANYPGHLIAALLLVISAGVTLFTCHTGELRKAKLQAYRLPLTLLQFIVIAIMLFILWDPSRSEESETSAKNSVLVIFDTSESMSVVEKDQTNRLDKALDLFDKKFRPFDPESPDYTIFGFDDQTYHSGSSDFLKRWGSHSNLHGILTVLNQYDIANETESIPTRAGRPRHQTSNAIGAVIFTDGQADDKNIDTYLPPDNNDFQLIVVGVGSRDRRPDLAIESIDAPSRMVIDSIGKVKVAVTARELRNQTVTIELLKNDYVVNSKEIAAGAFINSPEYSLAFVEFDMGADTLGNHTLSARAKAVEQEVNLANNIRSTMTEVVDETKLHVLFYSQVISFDIGKIRQALARDDKIDLDLGLDAIRTPILAEKVSEMCGYAKLPDNRQGFNKYDIVILGPCDLDGMTNAQVDNLYSFVVDRGGGLILLPGRGDHGPAGWMNKKIKTLIPMILDPDESTVFSGDPGQIELTLEAIDYKFLNPETLKDSDESVLPYYQVINPKPASTTMATVKETPLVAVHRVGRGRVGLVNMSKLFLLYREDREGGLLYELMAGLTAHLGRITHRETGIELFAERTADLPDKVKFEAYICDESFKPVAGANVLLSFGDRVLSMAQIKRGHYAAEIEDVRDVAIIATAQAEMNGVFLGEKTIAINLSPLKNEMSYTELDEEFLQSLAKKLNGTYVHIDEIDENIANLFEAQTQIGSSRQMTSIWPRWPLLIVLCVLLSGNWFLRRAIGLV
ncbi:MAG: hypothetical protein JXM79_06230 [Sedimentisphaerales bacterium]|nr:hypothetical protein [Sedimentisphaerales bacterium]